MSRVLVTAQALVVMPGTILRLSPDEAKERRHCTQPMGGGFYRVTLENHFKKGQIVEFQGDTPKHFMNASEPVDDDGRVLPPARTAATAVALKPEAPAVGKGDQPAAPSKRRYDLDGMTKAQLLDFAAQHSFAVDGSKTRAEIVSVLKKKARAAA